MSNSVIPPLVSPEARNLSVKKVPVDQYPRLQETMKLWQLYGRSVVKTLKRSADSSEKLADIEQMRSFCIICEDFSFEGDIYICESEHSVEGVMECFIDTLGKSKVYAVKWLCANPKNIKLHSIPNVEGRIEGVGKNCLRKALDRGIREGCKSVGLDYCSSARKYYSDIIGFVKSEKFVYREYAMNYEMGRYIEELQANNTPLSQGKIRRISAWEVKNRLCDMDFVRTLGEREFSLEQDVTRDQLIQVFYDACINGDLSIVEAILNSGRLGEIPKERLRMALQSLP